MMKIFSKQNDRSIDDVTLMKIDKAIDNICEEIDKRKNYPNDQSQLVSALASLMEARAKIK